MNLQAIFWSIVAVVVCIGGPITLVWTMLAYFRGRGSDRQGTGSFTAGIAGAMQELDRITRPSVEHKVDAERPTLKREDDAGND